MNYYKETPPFDLAKYNVEFFKKNSNSPCYTTRSHIHSAIEFIYITKGTFIFEINNETILASEGDLILIRANTIHSFFHPDYTDGEYYVLKLTSEYLFGLFKGVEDASCLLSFLKSTKNNQVVFKKNEISNKIKNLWKKMIEESNSNDIFMLLIERSYCCIFVINMYREFLQKEKTKDMSNVNNDLIFLIHKSVEFIDQNYETNITAEKCAKFVNLSYSYFAKLFKIIVGKTFKEYLTAVRMSKAYNLILETDLTITEVALSCGYNNHAYFTAEYKKIFKETPKETKKTT